MGTPRRTTTTELRFPNWGNFIALNLVEKSNRNACLEALALYGLTND